MVIDSTGTVKDNYKRYYAFGDAAQQTVSTDQRYRYTGKPFDDEDAFDLYYYGARYYDPKLGRFIAVDPLAGKYPEWSPYVYCMNNPLMYVDPNGDSLTDTNNDAKAQKAFVDLVATGSGGLMQTNIDANGLITVSAGEAGPLTSQQQAFMDVMTQVTDLNTGNTKISLTQNDSKTFVGSYASGRIDMKDISAFGEGPLSSVGALGHEIYEQYEIQQRGQSYAAAHLWALGVEKEITGSTRGSANLTGSRQAGTVTIRYYRQNKTGIATIKFQDLNITSVTYK